MFAGTYLLSGGSKAKAQQGPPINAGSKEEGDFIQYVYNRDSKTPSLHYAANGLPGSCMRRIGS